LPDQFLSLHAQLCAGRPARVVGEEDHDLAELIGVQLGGFERGADLDLGHVVAALADEQADQQQPPVADGQARAGPDLGEQVIDGQAEEVAGAVLGGAPA